MAENPQKQVWIAPRLKVFGDVESLTLSRVNKTGGAGDGLTFNGSPIHFVSG